MKFVICLKLGQLKIFFLQKLILMPAEVTDILRYFAKQMRNLRECHDTVHLRCNTTRKLTLKSLERD